MSNNDEYALHLAEQEAIKESIQLQQQQQQQQEQHRRRQQEAEEEEEEVAAAIRASLGEQQQEKDKALAASLHKEELESADQEYATAVEESDHHATAVQLNETMETAAKRFKQTATQDTQQGSWDCPTCTFTNPPYFRGKCRACGLSSPPLHVLTFAPLPSSLRFGVEIEIVVPKGKADGYTLPRIAQELTQLGPPRVHFRGYSHATEADWKIVTDASIQSSSGSDDQDLCFELVSPILVGEGEEGLGSMRAILDHVRRLGVATNATCGFHVHVDAEKDSSPLYSLSALQRLCQCFVSLENAFDLLVALSSWDDSDSSTTSNHHRRANANRYCRSNRLLLGAGLSLSQMWNQISSARTTTYLVQHIMNPPPHERYCKLNLTNITNRNRPSTVEFRHHGGVQDLLEAEAWVRLILLFCQATATCTNAENEQCVLQRLTVAKSTKSSSSSNARAEVEALFSMVGCKGLEQYYLVERRLFSENRFSNPWKCNVCHKVFETCQSLSQHVQARRHYS